MLFKHKLCYIEIWDLYCFHAHDMAVLDLDTRSRLLIQKEELHHNVTAGVVLSDHSLVLQSITRESAGGYTCMATNIEGRAKSNVVNLEVMCKYILRALTWQRERERERERERGKCRLMPRDTAYSTMWNATNKTNDFTPSVSHRYSAISSKFFEIQNKKIWKSRLLRLEDLWIQNI